MTVTLEKKKPAPPLEKDIQSAIVEWMRSHGYSVDVITSGMYGGNGIADIVACKRGRYVAVEVKRPGGKTTKLQEQWLARKTAVGGLATVAYSVQDVKEFDHYWFVEGGRA